MNKDGGFGWYPADHRFRQRFEQAVRDAFEHFKQHGDLEFIRRLISEVPDPKARLDMISQLRSQFPISVRANGSFAINRHKSEGFDWSKTKEARIWPRRISQEGYGFSIGGQTFTATELLEELIDVLVLNRKDIALSDLENLRATVDEVIERRQEAARGECRGKDCE
ncbi:hypothetical protein [Qipengyuania sphaerica]|uniref:hypothetical protein n=1 Tax=Qipengyuania sphaerica TaxID=2867243 RepID=UPI001C8856C2|nr:hypothetical protein [Qipengyuania sphaerica]MBX7540308.1 hypothetical protein [Qipengyuania sphaerica]